MTKPLPQKYVSELFIRRYFRKDIPTHKLEMSTLSTAILTQLIAKTTFASMSLADMASFIVKQTLKQVCQDHELSFEDLKIQYDQDVTSEPEIEKPVKPKAAPKKKADPKAKEPAPKSYSKMKRADLVAECTARGLSEEGTVPQLRDRLKGNAPVVKVVKPKKAAKVEVRHTHPLQEEEVDGCGLCDSHGNEIGGGGEEDDEFEESGHLSLAERLKKLLASEDEPEEVELDD